MNDRVTGGEQSVLQRGDDRFKMNGMETWVTSDLHLGCPQCHAEWFAAFLKQVPSDVQLVLNGDIMNRLQSERHLPRAHRNVLDQLRHRSLGQPVIWVHGNHDRHLKLEGTGDIRFVRDFSIGDGLYVAHGDGFDHLMPAFRLAVLPLKVVYEFLTRFVGRRSSHVAAFAKRLPALYEVLNGHVARNAVEYARHKGYRAVTCGHTHFPEHRVLDGIDYYNTGCWTEPMAHVTCYRDGRIIHARISPSGSVEWPR